MPVSGPQFELRITVRPQPGKIVVAARKEIDSGERLRVAAIEAFGQAHEGREQPHGPAFRRPQIAVALV